MERLGSQLYVVVLLAPLRASGCRRKDVVRLSLGNQLPKLIVKDCVTEMIRDIVGPGMKSAGFRRNSRVFWRDRPGVSHVAHVQMNRWGTSQESDFCIQLGVLWYKVAAVDGAPRHVSYNSASGAPLKCCVGRRYYGRHR